MKKLPREILRQEDKPGYEKEVWQPSWKCYCCHDLGIVRPHLVAMLIDGYDYRHDKLPRCQNQGCSAGSSYDSSQLSNCIDYRLSPAICQELDMIEREDWRQTHAKWHSTRKHRQVDFSSVVQNLRPTNRTSGEQMELMRRLEEVMDRIDQGLNHAERKEMLLRTGEINNL